MKKYIIISLAFCLMLSFVFAQNKVLRDPNAQLRNIKNFHAIHVATGIHLFLSQGNEEKIAVSADKPGNIENIKTELSNGVLNIYYDNGHKWFSNDNNRGLRVYVSYKILDALKGSSGSEVEVEGAIHEDHLDMEFSSGSLFKGEVQVGTLKLDQGSGSIVNISGSAANLDVKTSSGSICQGFSLQSQQCQASASSGGQIDITVQKNLDASAHSGGQIHYAGTAPIDRVNTGSGGIVSRK